MYKRKLEKSDKCLNCGTSLDNENYCPNCGQLNNIKKPNASELFFEVLSNLFAFDSKFYRSMGVLISRPGQLSLAFIEGKRQKYMLPIRLFIVITLLFIMVTSLSNAYDFQKTPASENKVELQNDSSSANINYDLGSKDWNKIVELVISQDSLSVEEGLKSIEVENTFWNRLFYHQVQKFYFSKSGDFQRYLLSKFMIYALVFIPFLAFLLKFFYLNLSSYYYIDHFIFAIHQQTVLLTFLLIYSLLNLLGVDYLSWLILAFGIHLLLALKNFYKEKWWLTVFKFFLVNIGFFFVSLIFVVLAGMVTFVMY